MQRTVHLDFGFIIYTTITHITNVIAMYNEFVGLAISMATDNHINNTSVSTTQLQLTALGMGCTYQP